jgi:rubrerythrin
MTTSAPKTAPSQTLLNLQAAYNGESNARAKYLKFATKADEEGYAGVASLFRAAARAEQIHAENHARVIRQLGATPTCIIEPVEVQTTAVNLKHAIAGEEYERDVMYPGFIGEATSAGQRAAQLTFRFALAAEAEHARLYKEALDTLETHRARTDYYVCVVCGFTTPDGTFARCQVCQNPKEKFEIVN